MFVKSYLRKAILLIFVALSFSSQLLHAQNEDDGLGLLSATYTSGSAYGLNVFYLDDALSWYTSITAVLPADELSGSDFSMDEVIGQHIGFLSVIILDLGLFGVVHTIKIK